MEKKHRKGGSESTIPTWIMVFMVTYLMCQVHNQLLWTFIVSYISLIVYILYISQGETINCTINVKIDYSHSTLLAGCILFILVMYLMLRIDITSKWGMRDCNLYSILYITIPDNMQYKWQYQQVIRSLYFIYFVWYLLQQNVYFS